MGWFSKLFEQSMTSGVPASLTGKRVLVAEPSVTIQKVIELTLGGISLVAVNNGSEAREALARERFDLVIAAVVMAEMNGYDLSAHVKSTSKTPVILLAGSFEPFDAERAKTARVDAVIKKPFQPGALISEVERLLSAGVKADR